MVGKDKIPKLRGEIVKAIGEKKVAAVQALSPTTYRIQFTSSSYRHERDVNGITFRGVTLTPHWAYDEVNSVFVDRAPLQMPEAYLFELLAPYGRVLSPEDLRHKLHNVKEGDLWVKLNNSKVGQVPEGGPAATSSSSPPSLTMADPPHIPHKGTSSPTHAPANNNNGAPSNTNIPNGDQPIYTNNKSSSPSLSNTISELKKVFKIPVEMDRKATSVAVPSSATEQSTASIHKSASLSSFTSKPSEVLSATLSVLKTGFATTLRDGQHR